METTGAEMNEARLRMTRHPQAADLILNKVSGEPGFWARNVIVMAGVPSIMQAMLDEVAPKLKIGVPILSEMVRADAREGDIGMRLRRGRQGQSCGRNRQLSVLQSAATRMWCLRPRCTELAQANARSRRCWSECGEHNRIAEPRPLTAKTFESPRERQ
jgi:molybdopterin-biosynthesis enzyme MoeA-like protein